MEKYIVNVFDVEYDIDELEDGDKMPDLPTRFNLEIIVPKLSYEGDVGHLLIDIASDRISEMTGFCVDSISLESELIKK